MIGIKHSGNYNDTRKFLEKKSTNSILAKLEQFGREGVSILSAATPKESGKTASSWEYVISNNLGKYTLYWKNSNIVEGVVVAVIIQYGHATIDGTYIPGNDYINPAMRPLFDKITNTLFKEVST